MHEVSLMQETLDIVARHASEQGALRVGAIGMKVGAASGVDADALAFAFEALSPGTIADGARLDIQREPAVCVCPGCRMEFEPDGAFQICPDCGQLATRTTQGQSLEVSYVELC